MAAPLLDVDELCTDFALVERTLRAVDRVSFAVAEGETVGLVGESGCGKSVTALSVMGLLRPPGRIAAGAIRFRGRDLAALPEAELRRLRGDRLGMIFQEPMTALNPVLTTGDQVGEPLRIHRRLSRREALARAVELFRKVGIADPERRVGEYPHQMSGGMRQRVMIAMALACGPDLLIADEPTTALDVTIQAQILDLLRRLQEQDGMAVLLITHDLGVVAETCDQVVVMYAGQVVERAPVREIFMQPHHPYTAGLLRSMPSFASPATAGPTGPRRRLVEIPGLVPRLDALPPGCRFQDRCPLVAERCRGEAPALVELSRGRLVRCHFPLPQGAA